MDYGYDLLMNPLKTRRPQNKLNSESLLEETLLLPPKQFLSQKLLVKSQIHESIKEHFILQKNIINRPLTLDVLDEIISTTLDMSKTEKFKKPKQHEITPPTLGESKNISIQCDQSKFDLTKLNLA